MSGRAFPEGFLWGGAAASYQIEGGVHEGGRGPSVWDTFAHTPGNVEDGATGDVACDHYHRYRDDVRLMADLGFHSYRFSIAWPRIQPTGRGKPNAEGVAFYDRLLDSLLEAGIVPAATLFHWDYPQALEDLGGWAHDDAHYWFGDYAEHCYRAFGDRIKLWITINEPWCYAFLGNGIGHHAPGKKDFKLAYDVGHGLLLGHGESVTRFRSWVPDGQIGITTNHTSVRPHTDSAEDQAAAERFHAFMNGWFLDPVYFGDYPELLKEVAPLKAFTPEQSASVSQSTDFMGLNFYTGAVIRHDPSSPSGYAHVDTGRPKTEMGWEVMPEAFTDVLVMSQRKWNPPRILVTENGAAYNDILEGDRVHDHDRVKYLHLYLNAMRDAIDQGVKVEGYYVWSVMDNFEWAFGYNRRFGITYVDYTTQRRIPKDSAYFYRNVIASNAVPPPDADLR